MSKAYVYAVQVNGLVRYIGKGRGNRMRDHVRIAKSIGAGLTYRATAFHRKLAEALSLGADVEERILVSGLDDYQAFEIERGAILGVADNQLWNSALTRGGMSGAIARQVWARPGYRDKHSKITAKRWEDPDARERMLSAQAAALRDPKVRKRLSEARKSERNAEASKRRWLDQDMRRRHREAVRASITHEMKAAFGERVSASWKDPEKRSARIAKFALSRFSGTQLEAVYLAICAHPGVSRDGLKSMFPKVSISGAIYKLKKKEMIVERAGMGGPIYLPERTTEP